MTRILVKRVTCSICQHAWDLPDAPPEIWECPNCGCLTAFYVRQLEMDAREHKVFSRLAKEQEAEGEVVWVDPPESEGDIALMYESGCSAKSDDFIEVSPKAHGLDRFYGTEPIRCRMTLTPINERQNNIKKEQENDQ